MLAIVRRVAGSCRTGTHRPLAHRRPIHATPRLRVATLRDRLSADLKDAIKTKNTLKSTTLRSVLAEVYAVDKSAGKQADDPTISSIIRKAASKRADAAAQFTAASRSDLADKEVAEEALLSELLPPLLAESEVDTILKRIYDEQALDRQVQDPKRATGVVLKKFYTEVDKSRVSGDVVRRRLEALLAASG